MLKKRVWLWKEGMDESLFRRSALFSGRLCDVVRCAVEGDKEERRRKEDGEEGEEEEEGEAMRRAAAATLCDVHVMWERTRMDVDGEGEGEERAYVSAFSTMTEEDRQTLGRAFFLLREPAGYRLLLPVSLEATGLHLPRGCREYVVEQLDTGYFRGYVLRASAQGKVGKTGIYTAASVAWDPWDPPPVAGGASPVFTTFVPREANDEDEDEDEDDDEEEEEDEEEEAATPGFATFVPREAREADEANEADEADEAERQRQRQWDVADEAPSYSPMGSALSDYDEDESLSGKRQAAWHAPADRAAKPWVQPQHRSNKWIMENVPVHASGSERHHQALVRSFLSLDMPFDALLLSHGTGTGKTRAATGATEDARRQFMRLNGTAAPLIVVIASNNVLSNFRLSLFDPKLVVPQEAVDAQAKVDAEAHIDFVLAEEKAAKDAKEAEEKAAKDRDDASMAAFLDGVLSPINAEAVEEQAAQKDAQNDAQTDGLGWDDSFDAQAKDAQTDGLGWDDSFDANEEGDSSFKGGKRKRADAAPTRQRFTVFEKDKGTTTERILFEAIEALGPQASLDAIIRFARETIHAWYRFFSYEKFCRVMQALTEGKTKEDRKSEVDRVFGGCFIVIDEAHNFRQRVTNDAEEAEVKGGGPMDDSDLFGYVPDDDDDLHDDPSMEVETETEAAQASKAPEASRASPVAPTDPYRLAAAERWHEEKEKEKEAEAAAAAKKEDPAARRRRKAADDTNDDADEGKVRSDMLELLIDSVTRPIRLLLLTATPMYHSPKEIIWLLKIMRRVSREPPLVDPESWFTPNGSLVEPAGRKALLLAARGFVSYMRVESDEFPVYQYAPTLPAFRDQMLTEYPATPLFGANDRDDADAVKVLSAQVCLVPMGATQQKLYQKLLDTVAQNTGYATMNRLNMALVMSYPSQGGAVEGKAGLDQFVEYDKKKLRGFKPKKGALHCFASDNVGAYSGKIAFLLDCLRGKKGAPLKGIVLVYSEFIFGGLLPTALALENAGYHHWTKADNDNLWAENQASKANPRKGRGGYIMITGERALSPDTEAAVAALKAPENEDAQSIKIVLISSAGAEGIDLSGIRAVFAFTPWYNNSKIEQMIGRAVRYGSHRHLDDHERNVTIFLLATVDDEGGGKETADLRMFYMAQRRSVKIAAVNHLLKVTAVDCFLNNPGFSVTNAERKKTVTRQIMANGDVMLIHRYPQDGSRECDFTLCAYTCQDVTDAGDMENLTGIKAVRRDLACDAQVKEKVMDAFAERYTYTEAALLAYVMRATAPAPDATTAATATTAAQCVNARVISRVLSDMIDDRTVVADKLKNDGTIVFAAGMYVFQPATAAKAHDNVKPHAAAEIKPPDNDVGRVVGRVTNAWMDDDDDAVLAMADLYRRALAFLYGEDEDEEEEEEDGDEDEEDEEEEEGFFEGGAKKGKKSNKKAAVDLTGASPPIDLVNTPSPSPSRSIASPLAPLPVASSSKELIDARRAPISRKDEANIATALRFQGRGDVTKSKLFVTVADLQRILNVNGWLSDAGVSAYMTLLQNRHNPAHVRFFHAGFTKALLEDRPVGKQNRGLEHVQTIYIPINLPLGDESGMHWCLAVVHPQTKSVLFYDSLPEYGNELDDDGISYRDAAFALLHAWLVKRRSLDRDGAPGDWTATLADAPHQPDGDSCGVFTVMFADALSDGLPVWIIDPRLVSLYREKIAAAVLRGRIDYPLPPPVRPQPPPVPQPSPQPSWASPTSWQTSTSSPPRVPDPPLAPSPLLAPDPPRAPSPPRVTQKSPASLSRRSKEMELVAARQAPVSVEDQEIINEALAQNPNAIVSSRDLAVTQADLARIVSTKPGQSRQLSDADVDAYMVLLRRRHATQRFYTSQFLPTLFAGRSPPDDDDLNQQVDAMFFPVRLPVPSKEGNRWCLVVVTPSTHSVQFYDPYSSSDVLTKMHGDVFELLVPWLNKHPVLDRRSAYEQQMRTNWLPKLEHAPRQPDGDSGAVFTIMFADLLSDDLPVYAVLPDKVDHYRQKIAAAILRGHIDYPPPLPLLPPDASPPQSLSPPSPSPSPLPPRQHQPSPHQPSPHQPSPHQPSPHQPSPHQPSPHQPSPHQPSPHQPSPQHQPSPHQPSPPPQHQPPLPPNGDDGDGDDGDGGDDDDEEEFSAPPPRRRGPRQPPRAVDVLAETLPEYLNDPYGWYANANLILRAWASDNTRAIRPGAPLLGTRKDGYDDQEHADLICRGLVPPTEWDPDQAKLCVARHIIATLSPQHIDALWARCDNPPAEPPDYLADFIEFANHVRHQDPVVVVVGEQNDKFVDMNEKEPRREKFIDEMDAVDIATHEPYVGFMAYVDPTERSGRVFKIRDPKENNPRKVTGKTFTFFPVAKQCEILHHYYRVMPAPILVDYFTRHKNKIDRALTKNFVATLLELVMRFSDNPYDRKFLDLAEALAITARK